MTTPRDLDVLSRTIYGEARGEYMPGKIAVAHVVMNRVRKGGWWGDTIETVCLKPKQFSCWDDHNRAEMESVDLSDVVFRDCALAALIAIQSYEPDATGGCTHYCRLDIEPSWAAGMDWIGSIGHHKFYRERKPK